MDGDLMPGFFLTRPLVPSTLHPLSSKEMWFFIPSGNLLLSSERIALGNLGNLSLPETRIYRVRPRSWHRALSYFNPSHSQGRRKGNGK